MRYLINTFPRSASTFLTTGINLFDDLMAFNLHTPFVLGMKFDQSQSKQVSIVRNPLDCVTSFIHMQDEQFRSILDLEYFCKEQFPRHSVFMRETMGNKDDLIIVRFKDVVNHPKEILEYVTGREITDRHMQNWMTHKPEPAGIIENVESKNYLVGPGSSSARPRPTNYIKPTSPDPNNQSKYDDTKSAILSLGLDEVTQAFVDYEMASQMAYRL